MKHKNVVTEEVKEVKEEIKDEVVIEGEVIEEEVIEEVKKEKWFSKTKKWFSKHKNEIVAFAAGAVTGTGLTVMMIAGKIKEGSDDNDEIVEVEVEEVTVEDGE